MVDCRREEKVYHILGIIYVYGGRIRISRGETSYRDGDRANTILHF